MSSVVDCIFCGIINGAAPATIVTSDRLVTVLMDIQPVNPGHLLVIPNQHADDFTLLSEETASRMFLAAQQMTAALYKSGLPCDGVNLFLANGEAAGQEVFHVHLHVFPRMPGDGFGLKFPPRYHNSRPSRADLETTATLIRAALG